MRYGDGPKILDRVSFSLKKGSFHFLTGASGAGKSTLIKLMYAGRRDYEGDINVLGVDLKSLKSATLPAYRQRIGIVFQDFFLLDHVPAIDNVALPLRVRGQTLKKSREIAEEMLAWVGLSDRMRALPTELSGGEKQRVALARAVIGRPKLLLADEPTGSVDDKIAVKLLYLFEELHEMGTTILLATHNKDLSGEFPHSEMHIGEQKITFIEPDTVKSRIKRYA